MDIKYYTERTVIVKKIIALIILSAAVCGGTALADDWRTEFPWAAEGVEYCINAGILQGSDGQLLLDRHITRSQTAKMLSVAFGLEDTGSNGFNDTNKNLWDYKYINAIEKYIPSTELSFRGNDDITREEFAALIGAVLGYGSDYDNSLHAVFSDAAKINYGYRGYVAKAVSNGIITGSNGSFRPKAYLTRAEACTMIKRAVDSSGAEQPSAEQSVPNQSSSEAKEEFNSTSTAILGAAQISVSQAQAWARSKGATEKFINIAPTYWYYGELTGIRPEVLYAQAALETGYGKYTGVVSEDMNNWAGIKVKGRNDDAKEAHETFATPEEGARAHFNHMAAYVGVAPVGEPHGRYYSVKSLDWAGSVRTLEELSGKWCPDPNYANKILEGCLIPMSKY